MNKKCIGPTALEVRPGIIGWTKVHPYKMYRAYGPAKRRQYNDWFNKP